MERKKSKLMEYAGRQEAMLRKNDKIGSRLFTEYGVYQGLRDENGKGVLTGLTSVSKIVSTKVEAGRRVPCEGELWYRGYRVEDLIGGLGEEELGYPKIAYLLLMGEMPNEAELSTFREMLAECRFLPDSFTRDVIMKNPTDDIMNSMTRSILNLAAWDRDAMDLSVPNVLRQSIQLISQFPLLAVYGYNAYNHYIRNNSMFIHQPEPTLTAAENLLRLLRPDMSYTPVEAKTLDTALILHMEHGGGNNSTFTTRVVTSTGSDTYSTIAAAMSSLKGPKHGGANIKVMEMIADIKAHVSDTTDDEAITSYLNQILNQEAFDRKGLIYGMGHAVYTLSDPRERVFKKFVVELAEEKHREKDLRLYESIERIAPELIAERRHSTKKVSPNVDFYSGFVYDMLDIPVELYTAIFAIARIVGWSAHRIEELVCTDKIIRPAYMSVMEERK